MPGLDSDAPPGISAHRAPRTTQEEPWFCLDSVNIGTSLGKPQGDPGWFLVPRADRLRALRSIALHPALDHPLRVRQTRCRFSLCCVAGNLDLPQDGIHHARGALFPAQLHQLYAVVEDRVGGHAVQMQELVCAHAQRGRRLRTQLCLGTRQQSANLRIEGQLPAQSSQHQGRGQVAVLGRERIHFRRVQQVIAVRIGGGDL